MPAIPPLVRPVFGLRWAILNTVCAEIITELIPERASPVIFKTLLLELMAFRRIPVISPVRRGKPKNYWNNI